MLDVSPENTIGGHKDITLREGVLEFPIKAMICRRRQPGGMVTDLFDPMTQNGCGTDNQKRPRDVLLFL